GNTVIVSFAMEPETGPVTCSDTKGNTYDCSEADVQNGVSGSGLEARTVVCSARITTALTNGNQITVSLPLTHEKAMVVSEFAGIAAVNRFDQRSTAIGNSTSPNSGSAPTTSQSNELLIGSIGYEGRNLISNTPPAGFTLIATRPAGISSATKNVTISAEYRIVSAVGSYSASGTLSSVTGWAAAITTYRSRCGNGIVDAGEQCDDGNSANGDCCNASCQYEAAGGTCGGASSTCDPAHTCDGTGTCQANYAPAGTACGSPAVTQCTNADTCDGS